MIFLFSKCSEALSKAVTCVVFSQVSQVKNIQRPLP